jgi:hypothetical protein
VSSGALRASSPLGVTPEVTVSSPVHLGSRRAPGDSRALVSLWRRANAPIYNRLSDLRSTRVLLIRLTRQRSIDRRVRQTLTRLRCSLSVEYLASMQMAAHLRGGTAGTTASGRSESERTTILSRQLSPGRDAHRGDQAVKAARVEARTPAHGTAEVAEQFRSTAASPRGHNVGERNQRGEARHLQFHCRRASHGSGSAKFADHGACSGTRARNGQHLEEAPG